MASDKPFYKLAIDHTAAVLKLLGVADYDNYAVSSITLKATENRRDLIFKSRSGKKILFVETHGYPDPYVLHALLDGMMLYCRQKKFSGAMRAAVIFLKKSHYAAALKFWHHFDGKTGLAFQPTILIMNQVKISDMEKLNDVRLIPLYPLCKISAREIEASIPVWSEQIKHARRMPVVERKELVALLGGFAMHRVKSLTPQKFNQLVGGFMDFTFEETRFGKELIREGVHQGVPQGMHRLLLKLLAQRFGAVPATIRRQIEKIDDVARLENIGEELLRAKNFKQLEKFIAPNGKSVLPRRNGAKATV